LQEKRGTLNLAISQGWREQLW